MEYNPDIHHRHSNRLKKYDYSQNGYYFITICVQDRQELLGKIEDGIITLSSYGEIVNECISKIETLHNDIEIPIRTVMPNHVHFIVGIVGVAYHATPNTQQMSIQEKSKLILPKLIQQFKTATVKTCNAQSVWNDTGLHNMQPLLQWQRNYHDHIIRNEQEYQQIYKYIDDNIITWQNDCYSQI